MVDSILQQYKDNHLDITSVKAKVASLFHRHTDLLLKFSTFLPEQESMGGEGGSISPCLVVQLMQAGQTKSMCG